MAQGKAAVIRSDLDIVIARTLARDTAKNMGFGAIDQARIATAVRSKIKPRARVSKMR